MLDPVNDNHEGDGIDLTVISVGLNWETPKRPGFIDKDVETASSVICTTAEKDKTGTTAKSIFPLPNTFVPL